mgnify:CR=1 FL=1|jgi:hypothetical protein
MAINLSANTQTTGPVAREVFDPNQGFQSGLEGVARGIQQVSSAANKFAQAKQNQDRKQGIVDTKLAGTNASVFNTGMQTAYANFDTVMGNSESTEEDRTAAEAAIQQYQGEFTSESFDPQGEVSSEYYSNYVKTSVALRDSLESKRNIGFQNRKQLKVIQQEIAGASQFKNAANGNPSADPLISEIAFSISNNQDPSSLASTFNDPEIYYKEAATSLDKTSSITFSRIAGLPPVEQAAQLDNLEQAVQELAKSESPALQAEVATMYRKIASAKTTIGVAGSNQRKEANEISDKNITDALELLATQLENKSATNDDGNIRPLQEDLNILTKELSEDATDTQIDTQAKTVGMYLVQAGITSDGNPTGNSIINRDVFQYMQDGVVPSLRKEDFFIDGKDYSKLIENAEFAKAYQAEVKSLSQQITTAVRDGDYSSLARVSPVLAKAWSTANDLEADPDARADAWVQLKDYVTSESRKDNPLFSGGPSFKLMPEKADGVSFSNMEDTAKVDYVGKSLLLNGENSLEVIQSLESSGKSEDREIGVSMRLQQSGLLEESLEYENYGTLVNAGSTLSVKNKDGEMIQVAANHAEYYKAIRGYGESPLSLLSTSASQVGDPVLSAKYNDIKSGMVARALADNPGASAKDVQEIVLKSERFYASALGDMYKTENGSIIVKPTADPKNPVQREIKAYEEKVANSALVGFPLNPLSVVQSPEDALNKSIAQTTVDYMFKNKVAFTPFLKMVADSENSPALQTALYNNDTKLNKSKESAAFIKGVLLGKNATNQAYVNYSRKHIINGVEHIVPQFLNDKGQGYSALDMKQPDGTYITFTIPASEVTKNQRNLYRSAYAEVDEQVSSLPAGGFLN